MREQYKQMKLEDIATLSNGKSRPKETTLRNFPIYGANGILDYSDKYNSKENTIIVGRVGSYCGSVYLSEQKCWATDNSIRIEATNQTDAKYLFYLLSKMNLNFLAAGSGQPLLNQDILGNLELSLPPLPEQKRISNILSSFDNKIEQLRKENNTLEDIAQSIFKEWFVKYNFPNKDGKPYRDNNGKMIDSELGLIPEGWRVGKLGELGKIICGKTPSKNVSDYFNGKYPFIKIPDMQDMFITKSEDSLTALGAKQLTGKLLPYGSICVSCIATIGKVSITTQASFTNQQINAIIPKEGTLEYLYFTLSNMKGYLEQIGNRGSTTFNINTNMFSNLLIAYPPESILSNYHTNTSTLLVSIQKNMKEIETLSKMKSALLSKLIS